MERMDHILATGNKIRLGIEELVKLKHFKLIIQINDYKSKPPPPLLSSV